MNLSYRKAKLHIGKKNLSNNDGSLTVDGKFPFIKCIQAETSGWDGIMESPDSFSSACFFFSVYPITISGTSNTGIKLHIA